MRAVHPRFPVCRPLVRSLLTACLVPAALAQPVCPPQPAQWVSGFNAPGITNPSSFLIWTADLVDDDGPEGPNPERLFLGGNFTELGGRTIRGIARWNPDQPDGQGGRGGWEGLPIPLFTSLPGTVKKIISFDLDGPAGPNPTRLIAMGQFATGNITNIAYFNGTMWVPLPTSGASFYEDAIVFDPDAEGPLAPELFVATTAGALRWNGTSLMPTGGPSANLNGDSLAVFDTDGPGPLAPTLFYANNNSGLVRWTGSLFTTFFPSPGTQIAVVATLDPDGPGPLPVSLITVNTTGQVRALQPGATAWTTLPSITIVGVPIPIGITVADPDAGGPLPAGLVVTGRNNSPGAVAWYFNGTAWSALGGTLPPPLDLHAIIAFDFDGPGSRPTQLLCGGANFIQVGNSYVAGAAIWDSAAQPAPAWRSSIPGNAISSNVARAAAVDPDGPGPEPRRLFVTASSFAGTQVTRPIARLDEPPLTPDAAAGWTTAITDTNFLPTPHDLAAFDFDGPGPEGESLVISRYWVSNPALNTPVSYTGRLVTFSASPQAWQTFGQFSLTATTPAGVLGVFDEDGPVGPAAPALYVSGPFNVVDGVSVNGLARWPAGAAAWQAPPVPYAGGAISAFATFDDDGHGGPNPPRLHVIASAGTGLWAVSRMDDTQWTQLGGPIVAAALNAIAGFDIDGPGPNPPRLYIGGDLIASPQPLPAARVQVWNGTEWLPAGTPFGNTTSGSDTVRSLVVFDDDGPGPNPEALFAAGVPNRPAGFPASSGLMKFDGAAWQPVAGLASGSTGRAFVFDADDAGPRPAAMLVLANTQPDAGAASSSNAALYRVPPVGADYNGDWLTSVQDVFDFLGGYFTGSARADIDGSGTTTVGDIFLFLDRYFAPCY